MKGAGAVGLLLNKKYVPVFLGMVLAVSTAGTQMVSAASHSGSGTAGVNVTANAGRHGGRDPDQKPDADQKKLGGDGYPGGSTGTGEGTGGDGAGSGGSTGSSAEPGSSNDTGEKTENGGTDSDSTDKDRGQDGADSGAEPGDSADAGGSEDGDDGSDADVETDGDNPGDGNSGGHMNPSSRNRKKKDPHTGKRDGRSDAEAASTLPDGGSGELAETDAGTAEEPDGGTPGDGSGAEEPAGSKEIDNRPEQKEGSWIRLLSLAAFLVAASIAVAAVILKRRGKKFHGILTDRDGNGIRFRRSRSSADVFVPALAEKLSAGAVSFQEYADTLMNSSSFTVLPYGTKMFLSVTDGETAGTGQPEDAEECRMLELLRKTAHMAHSQGKTVAVNVVFRHDMKGMEIRIHYVFR